MIKNLLLVLNLLVNPIVLFAQDFQVNVSKVQLKRDYEGFLLQLEVKKRSKRDKIIAGNYSSSYAFLRSYSFEEQIKILEELAKYFTDFSLCSEKVSARFLTTRVQGVTQVESTQYCIAIEAMFLMNYMAFGEAGMYLAKYPVLFNKCTRKEINMNDSENIIKMTKIYSNWINSLKSKGYISHYDLLDFYNKEIIWVDMTKMPPAREIIWALQDMYRRP